MLPTSQGDPDVVLLWPVVSIKRAVPVPQGNNHACAVLAIGSMGCWGNVLDYTEPQPVIIPDLDVEP